MGGSSKMNMPRGAVTPARIISSTVPLPEMKVCQSREHASTSANRLTAKKSKRSLRYSGISSRIRFQMGYGSSSIWKSYGS